MHVFLRLSFSCSLSSSKSVCPCIFIISISPEQLPRPRRRACSDYTSLVILLNSPCSSSLLLLLPRPSCIPFWPLMTAESASARSLLASSSSLCFSDFLVLIVSCCLGIMAPMSVILCSHSPETEYGLYCEKLTRSI